MHEKNMNDCIRFKNPDFPISVSGAKLTYLPEKNDLSKTWHEELEIKYFTSGSSSMLIDTTSITAQAGDIIIVNPYEYHANIAAGECGGEYYLFMIGLDFLTSERFDRLDLRRLLLGERVRFRNLVRKNARAVEILLRIADEMKHRQKEYELAVRGLVTELFAVFLRSEIECVISEETLNDNIKFYRSIEPALSVIRTNYISDISVEKLASVCGMSKFYFCRVFKRATGLTAIQYLTEHRLGIADMLLKNSDLSITQVANRTGFDDESYFSRCYKKSRGISPKELRAKLSK